MRRTRLGKQVGSVRTDPEGWTYWSERNWKTNELGYVVVAPSGARIRWFVSEADAARMTTQENREWFSIFEDERR